MIRAARILTLLLALSPAVMLTAQEKAPETIATAVAEKGTILKGTITGDQVSRTVVAGKAGQTLSVDLLSSNGATNFNITPEGKDAAIFIGSTSGAVADVPLPAAGSYVIEVYLERSAARRQETSDYSLGITLNGAEFADALTGGPDYWAVSGVGEGVSLNVRSGPDLRYPAIGRLANGETARNLGCRMTSGTRWCQIRATGSGLSGWVAGRYLIESVAPRAAEMPAGGPVGNGHPFDATGSVSCAVASGQPMHDCLFGVVRDGPGNAGVWITAAPDIERQILFEGGKPVTADAEGAMTYKLEGDLFQIGIGPERYDIPAAVINGG